MFSKNSIMSLLHEKLDEQLTFLQGAISINKGLKENIEDVFGEKYTKLFLEHEDLKMRIIEYESRECETCKILQEELSEEKKSSRSAHHRLKSIASLLNNEEGSPLTHAKWSRLTQILEEPGKLEHGRKRKIHSIIDTIDEKSQIVKKVNSKLISETFKTNGPQLQGEIIIPETQAEFENIVNIEDILPQNTFFESEKLEKVQPKQCYQDISNKEIFKRLDHQKNSISSQNYVEIELIKDILNTSTVKEETSSPSIIKDKVIESGQMITNKIVPTSDSIKNFDTEEKLEHKKESFWKLKPSTLIKMTNSGKFASESKKETKFKQTTLAINVKEVKKQDISSLQNFSGGIVNSFVQNSDEDSDVVFESPKNKDKKIKYRRKLQKIGTKDLDETLFQIPPAPATTTHLNYNSKVNNR
uniref:Uncharacterized protein n=1 Tax=Clastoptera arizonana TaxID=38151 RepID=A0A1B6EF29_9HEMI